MATIEVKVPDIGDFSDVEIIEVMVSEGDTISPEDPLIALESDKATMEVPSPAAGTVKSLKVKTGDRVGEGSLILTLETAASAPAQEKAPAQEAPPAPASAQAPATAPAEAPKPSAPSTAGGVQEVTVPDIGDFADVEVIEVMVKPGDTVQAEDPLIMLESDKASMEVPSPAAGTVKEVKVKAGDRVSEGTLIVLLEGAGGADAVATKADKPPEADTPAEKAPSAPSAPKAPAPEPAGGPRPAPAAPPVDEAGFAKAHASPAVRAFARELGVDLARIGEGSGRKGRILKEDVQAFVKKVMQGQAAPAAAGAPAADGGAALGLIPWPKVDFSKFGPVESKPLSRIKKISGANLHRNWVMIPHVTNHDDADITDLEAFRVQLNKEQEKAKSGIKVTMLAFLIKACVQALKQFPEFNASLDGDNLVLKQYFHVGFAADTPNGLVVPVIRDADKKGLFVIAQEMSELAKKAREGKLGPADMSGGCFSISSLGGIGGRYFTPIINAPEVAILGVCRANQEPVWDGKQFVPRLMLPLSLSWDHRVIDGAAAARFNAYLAALLADFRRAML